MNNSNEHSNFGIQSRLGAGVLVSIDWHGRIGGLAETGGASDGQVKQKEFRGHSHHRELYMYS